ncbi:hypothetical protein PORCRE_1043 [Porphyromonas crevioricanis JCM 15906]|uniref:Secretion system C-terminal sorting domain-containing protein n=2 Tax=Porphyromonas crevioricanis TaxID=393921 RepID=A0AB34PER7_9PORP|nr:T9SS type A sorting domain-containing protein [Porphyromonas crevioricanis]KGN93500.1 hypothetical protein HQ38_09140 [Porphyromonas crevioricanis]GAD05343.1 hypothetical protein PORCRE_1043 [Porphyromonas crevioricanis JCM 15906]SJZ56388.1 Por secretion system C-terminal sorting domain-containing protein [Porphyromonas crevioricanis]
MSKSTISLAKFFGILLSGLFLMTTYSYAVEPVVTLTVNDTSGEWAFSISARDEDKKDCWIDWNNNGQKDGGEEIDQQEWEDIIRRPITKTTIKLHGKLSTFECTRVNQLSAVSFSESEDLYEVLIENGQLTSLDVSPLKRLQALHCTNNNLSSLDVSSNESLETLMCRKNKITSLKLPSSDDFTTLTCSENYLESIDLSTVPYLEIFGCSDNRISEIIIDGFESMEELDLSNNNLSKITLSNLPSLTALHISKNGLEKIDLSSLSKLEKLECDNNKLSEIDLTKNPQCRILKCYGNRIGDASKMEKLISSLGAKTDDLPGLFAVVDTKNANEGNRITPTQVQGMKAKKWRVFDHKGGANDGKNEYDGDGTETPKFSVTLDFDPQFATMRIEQDVDLKSVERDTELSVIIDYKFQGIYLSELTANGVDIRDKKKFVVRENTVVKATFGRLVYPVTTKVIGEGDVVVKGFHDLSKVPVGEKLTVEATPKAGWALQSIKVGKEDITENKEFHLKEKSEVVVTFVQGGAAEIVENPSLKLYPNPVASYITLTGARAQAEIRIFSIDGSPVYTGLADTQGHALIDLSGLLNGFYLVQVGKDIQTIEVRH